MKSLLNKLILILFTALVLIPLAYWQISYFPEQPTDETSSIEIQIAPQQPAAEDDLKSGELPALITDTPDTEPDTGSIQDESSAPAEQVEEPATPDRWVVHEIQPGDTLSTIFETQNIGTNTLYRIINSGKEGKTISNNLRPGQRILMQFNNADDQLMLLMHEVNLLKTVKFELDDESVTTTILEKDVDKRVETASGTIASSLFMDGQKAGLSDRVIIEMAGLFNFDIDFAREIQPGDYFSVIYESKYIDGELYGNGNILAAEFVNNGKSFRVIRFENNGQVDYLNEKGQSRKKTFIRTPLNFRRISSKFTKSRYHPVLKRWRSHKGVDYAAKTGTPVWATGNGTVKRIERQRGYGKVIYLQHGKKYTTVYGHLSRFKSGLKKGSRVKQGDVIGYVGQTGLATGPHLHYEFRINDKHVDPLSLKLPASDPVSGKQLTQFKKTAEPLLHKLDQLKAPVIAARP